MTDSVRELRLLFPRMNLRNLGHTGIEWPQDQPLLIAALDTTDSGNVSELTRIYASFVVANVPSDYKVYFAVARERNNAHQPFEQALRSRGDMCEVLNPDLRKRRRLSEKLLNQSSESKVEILIGSTGAPALIDAFFDEYSFEWYSTSVVPLIVAETELPGWKDQLANLAGSRRSQQIQREIIGRSHCIMTTVWEHGMNLISDKIARPFLVNVAGRIATEHDLKLTVNERALMPTDS